VTPADVVRAFVEGINAHDVAALSELMTDDHVFVDALDGRVEGRAAMARAWKQYFALVPDYWVRLEELLPKRGTVAAFGRAGGTYGPSPPLDPANRWEIPVAWLAEVRDGRVSLWRVYADNLPIRKLMRSKDA
jgi:ketosteroid isomerase-like protein